MGVQINGSTGAVTGTQSDWSGNVSIGGTLTYEDVTNIDAVGLITARSGIEFGARPGVGASISVDGNAIFSGITTTGSLKVTGSGGVTISASGADLTMNTGGSIFTGTGGNASDPIVANVSDTNTGYFYPSADTLAVTTGGSERVRIDSSGRLRVASTAESADSAFDDVVVGDHSGNRGISILSGATSQGALGFAKSGSTADGYLAYTHNGTATSSSMILKSSGHIAFHAASTESARIDAAGRLLIGSTASNQVWGLQGALQVEGTTASTATAALISNQNSNAPFYLAFCKSRGTSDGSATIVQDGDYLGTISFTGADGTDRENTSGRIDCVVDGTPGGNDTPGRLMFSTTADGSGGVTERMRINSAGNVGINDTDPSYRLNVAGDNSASNGTGMLKGIIGVQNNTTAFGSSPTAGISFQTKYRSSPDVPLDVAAIWGGKENSSDADKDGYMAFATRQEGGSGTMERMRISSSGYVTIPNQVAFAMYGTGGNTTYTGEDIILTLNIINRDSCYNSSNGRFTAPVAGIYLFHFGFFPNSTGTYRVELKKNGSAITNPYLSGLNSSMGSGMPMPSGGQIVELAASDYITFAVNGTMSNTYNGHTGFSGILLA